MKTPLLTPRTYRGVRTPDLVRVTVTTPDGRVSDLDPGPSRAVRDHSPDGFNWGYGGSGPAQLALALLLDALGSEARAEAAYQVFKWEHVCTWGDEWSVTDRQILDWYVRHMAGPAAAHAERGV